MGMEKYEIFVKRTKNVLTYDPGWSEDNLTGAWRALRPIKDDEKCTDCGLCWLYCPEGCIDPESHAIDYAYCKGCGICARECRVCALELVREDE
jgi:2-oxoacid:acceptor oxidoreductase delta subunit (pyruvate/2-ketoisovalerate family)